MGIVNGLEKCTVTNPFRQIIDFLHRRDRLLDFAFESTVENTSLVTPVWASAAHSKVQLGRLPPQIESDDLATVPVTSDAGLVRSRVLEIAEHSED